MRGVGQFLLGCECDASLFVKKSVSAFRACGPSKMNILGAQHESLHVQTSKEGRKVFPDLLVTGVLGCACLGTCVFRLTCLKACQGGSQKVPNKRQIDETPPPYTIQPDMAVPPTPPHSVSQWTPPSQRWLRCPYAAPGHAVNTSTRTTVLSQARCARGHLYMLSTCSWQFDYYGNGGGPARYAGTWR